MNIHFDIDKLAQITAKQLYRKKIKSLDDVTLSRKIDSENLYDQISLEFFHNFGYINKYRINKFWIRNSNSFADKVTAYLNKLMSDVVIIVFSQEEWLSEIKKNIEQYGKRSKFTADFTVALSIKLQEQGTKCWLRCNYNWFKQKESRFKDAPFWRGTYTCIKEPNCLNKFVVQILKEGEIIQNIHIQIERSLKSIDHTDFVKYIPRCCGEKRDETAKDLMSIGVMNVQTNNVIHNSVSKSKTNINLY